MIEQATPTDRDNRLQELLKLLRESGYRLTPQRLAVVRVLVEDEEHPSAETIYGRLSELLPTTSLATVYNTLDALRDIDQVLEVRPAQGPTRFDVRNPLGHPHLICTRCGRVEDAPVPVEYAHTECVAAAGWEGLVVRLDFQGICPECQEADLHG